MVDLPSQFDSLNGDLTASSLVALGFSGPGIRTNFTGELFGSKLKRLGGVGKALGILDGDMILFALIFLGF